MRPTVPIAGAGASPVAVPTAVLPVVEVCAVRRDVDVAEVIADTSNAAVTGRAPNTAAESGPAADANGPRTTFAFAFYK